MVRLKHRYLIGQLIPDLYGAQGFVMVDIFHAVRDKFLELHGDVNFGLFGKFMALKFFDADSNLFVIRISREGINLLRLALACVTTVKRQPCVLRSVRLCGSGRTCKTELLKLIDRIHSTPRPSRTGVDTDELRARVRNQISSSDL
jgi:RNase P/RNase MRP subunit POP5